MQIEALCRCFVAAEKSAESELSKRKKSSFGASWKDYLAFSSREKIGMYVLLVIFAIQISISYYLNHVKVGLTHTDPKWLDDSGRQWMTYQADPVRDDGNENQRKIRSGQETVAPVYFRFNPNTCDESDFRRMGLKQYQVAMIMKYRSKSAGYRTKSDFKKMYCINAELYTKLEPWIDLPDRIQDKTEPESPRRFEKEFIRIDLSNTDSTELIKLPGIGQVFSRRIILYGNKLGGYYCPEQLREVWGMTDSLYDRIMPHLFVSDSIPLTLAINSISQSELGKHPYVGYKLAKIIISYRTQHGSFKMLDDLKSVPLLSDENFRKLAPYVRL